MIILTDAKTGNNVYFMAKSIFAFKLMENGNTGVYASSSCFLEVKQTPDEIYNSLLKEIK